MLGERKLFKKIVSGITVTMLLISMIIFVFDVHSPSGVIIAVINPETGGNEFTFLPSTLVNSTFIANVTVMNILYLSCWQINITWNSTLLRINSTADMILPSDNVFGSYADSTGLNITSSNVFWCAQPGLEAPFEYVNVTYGTLCQIRFTIKEKNDETPLTCNIHFVVQGEAPYYTKLINIDDDLVSYTAQDGKYFAPPRAGPSMDNLLIKYYGNTSILYDALKNGEVDLTDLDLTQAQMDEVFNNTNVQAAVSPAPFLYEFDFNNNDTIPTYPDWASPTAYKEFRQGIACLVNKTHIVNDICNYAYRIDTPIPRPTGDYWVDWSVSQYGSYGNLLNNYPYEYDSERAAYYFNLSGFLEGDAETGTPNPYYDENFPSSAQYLRLHPETLEDLEPLIFYIRNDDPRRLEAGRILRDNLRKMGIPVNAIEANRSTCLGPVLDERDYHIYTGGWSIDRNDFELLSAYSSENIGAWASNYPQFSNATYDESVQKVMSPENLDVAKEAALKCQKILVQEAVCVWLWNPSLVMGYRNIYGVVNERGERIDNQWTFLTARLGVNATRTEIYYGLYSTPISLNIVTDYPVNTFTSPILDCLSRIYDTLLSYCPYDKTPGTVFEERDRGGTMPWMAEDWEIGVWESPYNPAENLTKLTFYLRDGIKWHDGVMLNSTDVQFTIEYLKGLGNLTRLYSEVSDVHHVTTPNARTVEVYENVSNIWTLDMIGSLPILPKHIFQSITNVTGYTPGTSQGLPASQGLVGSGPWKYVNHSSSMLYLEANRDYFMETPPIEEIDFRYDWEMGCWAVDAMDATMVGEAFGSSGSHIPDTNWEPGCDVAWGDCIVDMSDLDALDQRFNATWGRSAKRYIIPPPTDTAIYVEPQENPVVVGEMLTVYVKLENLGNLSGLQFKLNYDNNKLYCLNISMNDQIFDETYTAKYEINQTEGFLWISLSSLASSVSGNLTLAEIYFNATKPSGSVLDLWNTKLVATRAPGLTCQLMPHRTLDHGVMVGVSTPIGTNVTVSPAENANVTFASTTTGGVTTLNIIQPPSTEFVSVLCNEIKTTANYTGNITIQFTYDPTGLSLEDEQAMKIWLWNESSRTWTDITTFVDTDNNIIYGTAPHLSIFGITRAVSMEGDMSQEGEITVGTPAMPPDPPPGLVVLNYYEISTTKSYTGAITLRLIYSGNAVPPEEEIFIRIWLWNESSPGVWNWIDITTFVNTTSNTVYGITSHLSIFGITSIQPAPPTVAVVQESCSRTIVGQGCNLTISFTYQNLGLFTENFTINVYRNLTILETRPNTTLPPGAQIALSFTFNTTDWAKGNCSISVCAHLIKWVFVTIRGDLNADYIVDGQDYQLAKKAVPSSPGSPKWNPNADLNDDGIVDGQDFQIVKKSIGQHYP